MSYFDFTRHYDIDTMLMEDAKWLAEQVGCDTNTFLDIAIKLDLRQEDWDRFWKTLRDYKEDRDDEITDLIQQLQNNNGEIEYLLEELKSKISEYKNE